MLRERGWQVQQAMEKGKIAKVGGVAALDRLIAPIDTSVTLQTLTRGACAVGRGLRIELV